MAALADLFRQLLKKEGIILAIVVVLGAGLRLNGLLWDAPYFFNPDEKRLINWGMNLNYLDPGVSEWGTLPLLVIKFITLLLGLFDDGPDQAAVYLVARGLSVLLGCGIIFFVYKLAYTVSGRPAAIYGALFTAFTVLLIQYAHFYSLDTVFTFFMLAALFPIMAVIQTGRLKYYVLAGLSIGLVVAVRLNGWFLLGPLFIAHYSRLVRLRAGQPSPPWKEHLLLLAKAIASKELLFAFLTSVGVFVIFTPALLLNPGKYLFQDGLIWVLLQSQGYLKSQYTLQFEGTTAWFYVSNLLYWSAGPVLLVAYGAGLITSLYKWRKPENLVILAAVVLYFVLIAGSRAKFIRYCLPALPLLNIMAAQFFASAWTVSRKNPTLKWSVAGWLGVTVVGSAVYALAFANIYSEPDVRIVAADWVHQQIPPGATLVYENDVVYAPPLGYYDQEQAKYHFREIDLNYLYHGSPLSEDSKLPPLLARLNIPISRRGQSEFPAKDQPAPLTDPQKWAYIRDRIYCADYLILSDRHASVYRDKDHLFPVESAYYRYLFGGGWGFYPVTIFERRPQFLGWRIDDSRAELTFRIFDHPTVWIFQAQLPPEDLDRQPPQFQASTTWADQVRLVGYDLDKSAVRPGQELHLTLYWEALTDMGRDYTIFLQLQDDSPQVVAQNDHQVGQGLLPTSCWRPGRIIKDTVALPIPLDAPAGRHRLKLGWYLVETLERLPILNDTGGENALFLAEIEILE